MSHKGTEPTLRRARGGWGSRIQSELAAQITAGHLPAPVNDTQGNANSFYMIYFPPGVTINLDGFISCQQFCAYHGNTLASLTLPPSRAEGMAISQTTISSSSRRRTR